MCLSHIIFQMTVSSRVRALSSSRSQKTPSWYSQRVGVQRARTSASCLDLSFGLGGERLQHDGREPKLVGDVVCEG